VWKGGPRAGEGTVTTGSGVFENVLFTATTANNDEFPCTCPSEMLAAAAASCVSLMVARELAVARIPAEHVETTSELEIVETSSGWEILGLRMTTRVAIGAVNETEFHKAIKKAKQNCAISNALKCPITLDVAIEKHVAA
jgi:osmotically inducible protein OsmC